MLVQPAVHEDGRVQLTRRPSCVPWDDPGLRIPEFRVQLLCCVAYAGVQYQQLTAAPSGRFLDCAHERSGDSPASSASVHEQFHHLSAVRAVRHPREIQWYRSNECITFERREYNTMVGPDGPLYGLPVGAGSRFRERTQEADGRTAIDRVLKELCEGLKVLTYPVFVDSTNDRRHLPGITLATRGPTSWLPIVGSRRMRAVRIPVRIRRGGRPPRLSSGRA